MFIFKLFIVLTIALAYTSAASIPESENLPAIDLESNYGSVKDQVNYNFQTDQPDVKQASLTPVTSDDNSTHHSLEPVKGWFYRAVDFVENAFTGMLDKSTSFVKGFEEKNTDDDKSFWNRSSQVIEVFGQKFLKVRTVEKKITNSSIAYIEKEVIKPLTVA